MRRLRVAIVYDCLYPYTVGGGERWYRSLAGELAKRHEVTYVTRRLWPEGAAPDVPEGVAVVAVCEGGASYAPSGRRRPTAPLRFGAGVLRHLLADRRRYDVVHTCGLPYFSLLAARLAERLGGPPVVTDWLEVWSPEFWRESLGGLAGAAGERLQRLCLRATGPAFTFADLTARRMRELGYRGEPRVLRGLYGGAIGETATHAVREPLVVYLGRHVPEKRVAAIPGAIAVARREIPELRATLFGDGPERPRVLAEIERLGLAGAIGAPGFVPEDEVERELRRASCLVLPSTREGFGLAVIEAAARGVPSIVTRAPDNAATELVVEGENGFVVDDAAPATLAAAIVRAVRAQPEVAERAAAWLARERDRFSVAAAAATIEGSYEALLSGGPHRGP